MQALKVGALQGGYKPLLPGEAPGLGLPPRSGPLRRAWGTGGRVMGRLGQPFLPASMWVFFLIFLLWNSHSSSSSFFFPRGNCSICSRRLCQWEEGSSGSPRVAIFKRKSAGFPWAEPRQEAARVGCQGQTLGARNPGAESPFVTPADHATLGWLPLGRPLSSSETSYFYTERFESLGWIYHN